MHIVRVLIYDMSNKPGLFKTNIEGLKNGDFVNCDTRFGFKVGMVLGYVVDHTNEVANWAFQKVDIDVLRNIKASETEIKAIKVAVDEMAKTKEEQTKPDLEKGVECHELHRVYHYRDGSVAYYSDIKAIAISKSGNHRLKTVDKDGKIKLHIVAPGWKSIDITPKGDDWTF